MSKALSFVRLDFITIKPYLTLKNLVILILVAYVISMGTGGSSAVISIFVAYGSIYASYPFAVGEQNGIDTLYSTLPLNRKNVVLGRYAFAVCLNILACIIAYAISFAGFAFSNKGFDWAESAAVLVVVFFIFSFVEAIQLPIYFKLGYAKAKLLAYLPFMSIPVVVFIFNSFFKKSDVVPVIIGLIERVAANPAISVSLCFIVLLLALCISYRLSLKFYTERDF